MAAKQAGAANEQKNVDMLLSSLRTALNLGRAARPGSPLRQEVSKEMLDAFEGLDALLSNGGSLPEAWGAAGSGRLGDPELYVLLDEHGLVMRTSSRPSEVDGLTAHLAGKCRWVRYVSTPVQEPRR